MYRTVVVGSGCAGLNCADLLAEQGEEVLLVTENMSAGTSRNTGSDKQTYYKLSLAGNEGDSIGEMARDLSYPDVHADIALCEAAGSVPSFLRLCSLGVAFPRNSYGEYVGYQTDHDTRTRATSAGPLTSKYMTEALERALKARHISILDHALAFRVVKDTDGVCALDVYHSDKQKTERIPCANLVLATGGPAHIYRDRVYPESQHGMSSLAFQAGAKGENLDCWQYGIASTGFRWNLSGSYQQVMPRYVSVDRQGREYDFLTQALGKERAIAYTFLKGYQWPFDPDKIPGSSEIDLLVSRELELGRKVYLDYLHNPQGFSFEGLNTEARTYLENSGALQETPVQRLLRLNPPAYQLFASHGTDLIKDMLSISVCAQHHNGGIAVDINWQTSVPGLYVCGEAAGTFGRKRPGGSALNSTQVGSSRAAAHIMKNRRITKSVCDIEPVYLVRGSQDTISALQDRMTRSAGHFRDKKEMLALRKKCEDLLAQQEIAKPTDKDFLIRLFLQDIVITQYEVLSAMLFAAQEQSGAQGVLETYHGFSRRIPARQAKDRDLWFERVWRKERETTL